MGQGWIPWRIPGLRVLQRLGWRRGHVRRELLLLLPDAGQQAPVTDSSA